jgi:hypothetical protein
MFLVDVTAATMFSRYYRYATPIPGRGRRCCI